MNSLYENLFNEGLRVSKAEALRLLDKYEPVRCSRCAVIIPKFEAQPNGSGYLCSYCEPQD